MAYNYYDNCFERIPTVDFCCGCINLKTGGVILGALNAFWRFYDICKIFAAPDQMPFDQNIKSDPLWDEEALEILSFLLNLIGIFVSCCYVVGILKERPKLMIPEVITNLTTFIVLVIITVYSMFDSSSETKPHKIAMSIGIGVHWIEVLFLVLIFYFWIVQFSIYKSIKITVAERNQHENGNIERY